MEDDKQMIKEIYDIVKALNTSVALTIQKIEFINKQGCEGSMEKIKKLEDDIEKNANEHSFIKGIAYTSGLFGTVISFVVVFLYYLINTFWYKH